MGVLRKTSKISGAILRRCSTAPLTAPSSSSTSSTDIANSFLQDHIRQMQTDILEKLIPHDSSGNVENLGDLNVTSNLGKMTEYYFMQGGKMLRPTVSLLMASACNSSTNRRILKESQASCQKSPQSSNLSVCKNQYKIGMISEMIHTASLVHDDVIDEANTRRGSASVNAVWGNKMSVLVGDFILARTTQILCSTKNPQVISVMAGIIEDLVLGEFMQMATPPKNTTPNQKMTAYIEKTHRKTASLFANSCRSVAILADETNASLQNLAYDYGRNLGIAFQLVDDLLDIIATENEMGKPTSIDLKLGLATAPVLFATQQFPELAELVARKFKNSGDIEKATEIVANSNGIKMTRKLIAQYSEAAEKAASSLPNRNEATERLIELAISQSDRKF
ncbi:unnamed protein product [Caenorhabditis angaria]|uniref:Uncharacterized protein n=1 Tax=Caenorhabditis angaria TaxID=860376 RepID=A0A9P1I6S3_9PELO|nr:unnamed protein product [Caenorhabditis angaria]